MMMQENNTDLMTEHKSCIQDNINNDVLGGGSIAEFYERKITS